LLKYPNGLISQQATFALEQLDKAKITAQADKNGLVQVLGASRFRVGDQYVRVTKDDYSGRVIQRIAMTIDRIEGGMVFANSKNGDSTIYTVDGAMAVALNTSGRISFDPPRVNLPGGEIKVGMKWASSTIQTNSKGSGGGPRTDEFKVVAYEDISVPAGTFKTFKILMNSWVNNNRVENTYWYLPDWGIPIKNIRKVYPLRGAPVLESIELESFVRGGAVSATQPVASEATRVASR